MKTRKRIRSLERRCERLEKTILGLIMGVVQIDGVGHLNGCSAFTGEECSCGATPKQDDNGKGYIGAVQIDGVGHLNGCSAFTGEECSCGATPQAR